MTSAASSSIRPAACSDLDLLSELIGEFYAESDYDLEKGRMARALAVLVADATLGRLWLIVHAGETIGYIAVAFGFSLEYHGRDAIIDELFIRPSFRGSGIGTRVLESVETECRALGIQALHLEVEASNPAGQALYRRRGFGGNDRQLLSKRLVEDPPPSRPAR